MILILAGVVIFVVGFVWMVCTLGFQILLIILKSTPNGGASSKSNWSAVAIAVLGFLTVIIGLIKDLVGLLKDLVELFKG
jgi:biotin transporter BioY